MGRAEAGRLSHHLAGILVLTLLLLWPAFWSGAPTAFSDTSTYYNGGGVAVDVFLDRTGLGQMFEPEPAARNDAGGGEAPTAEGSERIAPEHSAANVRSVPYSVFVNLAMRTAGPMAAVIPTALVTAWLIWLLMAPLRPVLRLAGGAVTALVTTAPFYASQIMPDIHAAWLIAIPIIVLRRRGKLGWPFGLALFAAATTAILFHYSHIPLAAATGVMLGLWFALSRRFGAAAVVQLPLVLAVAINISLSLAMAGIGGGPEDAEADPSGTAQRSPQNEAPKVSVAPGRLPIVLARLLEDGVAVDYLSETCPENGFAICEVYEKFPSNVGAALWGENSIRNRATPAQLRRIMAEEMDLVRSTVLYDPVGQLEAMARNTLKQMAFFRLQSMNFSEYEILSPFELRTTSVEPPEGLFGTLSGIQYVAVVLSALILLVLVWRVPTARWPISLLFVGLLANAFICGALSAPVGRYQGRVIWLTVALASSLAPLWLERVRQRQGTPKTS